jgi:glycosyltransferase involved in cell wall biosynthesis
LTGLPNYPEGRIFDGFTKDPGKYSSFEGARIVRVPILPRRKGKWWLGLNYLSFMFSGMIVGPCPLLLGMFGRLVRFIYRRCSRILVQSRAFRSNVEKFGGAPAKIRYFPGWPELQFLESPKNVDPAMEMQPFAGNFNIVFAGNLGEAQDFPSILDAAEALVDRPSVRWLIIGDGRAGEYVRSEIRKRDLQGRVIMLGRHPLERMPSFFRDADALLVTLKKDPIFSKTIPGKVQSYLATGIPLLGMLDGEGAKVIQESGSGYVVPAGDGQQLAAWARKLADMSESERAEMGQRGRHYCNEHFNRDYLLSALEDWMVELTPRPPAMGSEPE